MEVNFEAKRPDRVGSRAKSGNHHRSQCQHASSRPSHELDHTSFHAPKAIETAINAHAGCQRVVAYGHRYEETACFSPPSHHQLFEAISMQLLRGVASDFRDSHGHRPDQLHWPSIDSMAEGWHRDLASWPWTCQTRVSRTLYAPFPDSILPPIRSQLRPSVLRRSGSVFGFRFALLCLPCSELLSSGLPSLPCLSEDEHLEEPVSAHSAEPRFSRVPA